jgi:23S rRNA pseudouridine1911/1915/1917 synthase
MTVVNVPESTTSRIDQWLSLHTGRSRAYIQSAIQKGDVKLNGKVAKASAVIHADDSIDYLLSDTPLTLVSTNIPLDILFEDNDILVINKPAGLTVHPGAGNKDNTLVNALLHYGKTLSSGSQFERPGIVHRLDKDTSGVLVVAKNNEAHNLLAKAFAERQIEKIYLGLVFGDLTPTEDLIDAPIARHPSNYKKFVVDVLRGKEARTGYKVLRVANDKSLVQFQLFTGRTHQIRVHMAHLGHPLIGDSLYGRKGGKRQLLHAHSIAFDHPRTHKRVKFTAPEPLWALSF